MNKHRFVSLTIATIPGLITVFAFAPAASAQGAGIYELVGSTSQGDWLELVVTPGPDLFTVTSVRLSGMATGCTGLTSARTLALKACRAALLRRLRRAGHPRMGAA